jgi:hypothetical protein
MQNTNEPLKVFLHGMDSRYTKKMELFLQRPCNNVATVVQISDDAQIDVFDLDCHVSKTLLEAHLQLALLRPVIVLSLLGFEHKGIVSVKKPINTDEMLFVLEQIKKQIPKKSEKTPKTKIPPLPEVIPAPKNIEEERLIPVSDTVAIENLADSWPTSLSTLPQIEIVELKQESVEDNALKTIVFDTDESKKNAMHQTAMHLNDKGFHDYLGSIEDVDVNDPNQFSKAHYNPSDYYQGVVQSAIAACRGKNQVFLLPSNWRALFLFPSSQEVWLDGSYAELNVYAGIKLKHRNTKVKKLLIIPVDPDVPNISGALNQCQSMEAFLWQLACWTSMGRYPNELDYRKPVYLKHWPNFTRLLVTPHALRIAALLVHTPKTMAVIAKELNIKPQYVFVFVSATYALGLLGQCRRLTDNLVETLTKKRNIEDVLLLNKIKKKLHTYKN